MDRPLTTYKLFDTHAHLISNDWDRYRAQSFRPDLPMPDRPGFAVTVEALIDLMDAENVSNACLVQRGHIYAYDNSYLIDSARKYPGRLLPVVILDATDPKTAGVYRNMVRDDAVCGLRMAQSRPHILDTAWLNSPEAMAVWKVCADLGTPVSLIVFMNQLSYNLPAIRMIARMFPDLPILLDHGAMPFGMTQYEVGLAQEAGEAIVMPGAPHFGIDTTIAIFEDTPNVHFKITEINQERFAAAGVRAAHVVRRMIDGFGPDRLMWGSDIGQSMKWNYAEKAAMGRATTDFLTEAEARGFLHDNAAQVYGFASRAKPSRLAQGVKA